MKMVRTSSKGIGIYILTHPRILPINVDTIKVICNNKACNIFGHGQPIRSRDALAEDGVSARVCRESPPAKRQDLSCSFNTLEVLKFICVQDIANLDLIVTRERAESKMQMRVL